MNILGLPTASALDGSEVIYGVQGGTDVKIPASHFGNSAGSGTISDDNYGDVTVSGSGTIWTVNFFSTFGRQLAAASSAAATRAALNLVVGTDVQAQSAKLDSLAGVSGAANMLPYFTGANTLAVTPITAFARSILDDADADAVKATLGITSSGGGSGGSGTYQATSVVNASGDPNVPDYLDCKLSKRFNYNLAAANAYLSIPLDGASNPIIYIKIKQDSVGGRSVMFHWQYRFKNGVQPTLNSGPSQITTVICIFDEVSNYWDCIIQ